MRDNLDLSPNPIIEFYKKDVDHSLIAANLRRTPDERVRNMIAVMKFAETVRAAVKASQEKKS